MRKIPVVLLLALAFITIATMQNCGGFSPSSGFGDQAPGSGPIANNYRAEPLSCDSQSVAGPGNVVTLAEQIAAYGRLGHDGARTSFITKSGRVFHGFPEGALSEVDKGTSYKWFSFGSLSQCGVTTSDRVRCRDESGSGFHDVPELAGSTQVISFSKDLTCGLMADGVRCLNNGVAALIATPEPIILLSEYSFFGKSLKMYNSYRLATGVVEDWSGIDGTMLGTRNAVISYSDHNVTFCNQPIVAASFVESENYQSDRGCGLGEKGDLFCVDTFLKEGKLQHVSLSPDGEFSRNLRSIDPGRRYLALSRNRGGRVCAVRSDNEIVCFSAGFQAADYAFSEQFKLNTTTKDLFRITSPSQVTSASANSNKACVIKAGVGTCWANPTIENGVVNQPYVINSKPLLEIAGFLNQSESNRAYARACFLNQDRSLVCEKRGYEGSRSGEVVEVDPGVTWKNFYLPVTQPSKSCGLTATGEIRCMKTYTGLNEELSFETRANGAVFGGVGYYLLANGSYISESDIMSNGAAKATSIRYASDVPNHPNLFNATDGKRYALSYQGPVELSNENFAKIQNSKRTGFSTYFDEVTDECHMFSFASFMTRSCSLYVRSALTADPLASYAFVSSETRMYLTSDGRIFGDGSTSSEQKFSRPTVVTPDP